MVRSMSRSAGQVTQIGGKQSFSGTIADLKIKKEGIIHVNLDIPQFESKFPAWFSTDEINDPSANVIPQEIADRFLREDVNTNTPPNKPYTFELETLHIRIDKNGDKKSGEKFYDWKYKLVNASLDAQNETPVTPTESEEPIFTQKDGTTNTMPPGVKGEEYGNAVTNATSIINKWLEVWLLHQTTESDSMGFMPTKEQSDLIAEHITDLTAEIVMRRHDQ